ncbi:hypothetical protein ACFQ60_22370 [Streptomyces zhihengii]
MIEAPAAYPASRIAAKDRPTAVAAAAQRAATQPPPSRPRCACRWSPR